MTRIVIDDVLRNKLNNLTQPLELCDDQGQVLGRVFPVVDQAEFEAWEPSFSEEELRQAEESTEWFTTAEV